jgi:hypothetical protein
VWLRPDPKSGACCGATSWVELGACAVLGAGAALGAVVMPGCTAGAWASPSASSSGSGATGDLVRLFAELLLVLVGVSVVADELDAAGSSVAQARLTVNAAAATAAAPTHAAVIRRTRRRRAAADIGILGLFAVMSGLLH